MKNKLLILVFITLVAPALAACANGGGPEPTDSGADGGVNLQPDAGAEESFTGRWKIGPENPLFMFNVYFGANGDQAASLAALIPDDVRPYFGVQLVGKYPYNDVPEHRQWVEAMVDAFASLGIPTFVQGEAFNTRSDIPMSFYESLFDRTPLFLGIVFAELSANGATIEGLDDDMIGRIVRTVETVAARDGFFLWQDMGYEWSDYYPESGHPFVEAGSSTALFDLFTRLGKNVILQDKHNGSGKRFQGPAAAMGWWSSGLVHAWGVNSEDWLWWEAGWGPLFGPNGGGPKAYDVNVSRWNFPQAMTGQDWLADLAGGASVFSIETGFANGDFSQPTPALIHVQLPFMRQVLKNRTLLSRAEFRQRARVAYQPAGPWGFDMHNDDVFKGLYGPKTSSLSEWLPSTGRYFYLPVLPTLAGNDITSKYQEVVGTAKWKAEWKNNVAAKQSWFDKRYPAVDGDAWFVNVGDRWFLMNPNENVNKTAMFSFALTSRPCLNLSGSMEPDIFAFVMEKGDGVSIMLSNYRIDGQGMLDDFGADGVFDAYMKSPYDGLTRHTEIALSGLEAKPAATVTGSRDLVSEQTFSNGKLVLKLDHNCAVNIEIPVAKVCK